MHFVNLSLQVEYAMTTNAAVHAYIKFEEKSTVKNENEYK